ncbi:DUF5667 domain-containing protein [Tepidiforma thermophila]|uniref:DUF5667 domain-containing protein n=1 Tax=Tepidiforma thermophila (strain KCTC 52669 / CGMCC 1.13589 / G233) TaxID=2761530 RepID=A0A2A9HDY7_TEPT2|nr:DUF5667 domain-containing protein [Tepidiforma thermophila]PFG73225.1 hypothetical protein A9A59_0420 [Tepidiforma thermophila]
MIRRLFDRKAGHRADILAEAQALIDDGLEPDFVLSLFPEEADWLAGMLRVTAAVTDAYAAEPASYYFEASLKAKVLARATEPTTPAEPLFLPVPGYSPVRTAVASMAVLSGAAAVGVLALGFVTAGDAVPGDWNYAFKLANERLEYTLSRGDARIDVQLRQAEARVYELQQLAARNDNLVASLEGLQRELRAIADLAEKQGGLTDVQKARVRSLAEQSSTVLSQARNRPDVDPEKVAAAAAAIDDAVSAALGGVTPLATPEPTAAAAPEPSPTGTPEPAATATGEPAETATPEPAGSATPEATPATPATAEAAPSATVEPAEARETPAPQPSSNP